MYCMIHRVCQECLLSGCTLCLGKKCRYRLKIINPNKKSEFILVRDLHHFHGIFDSVLVMKMKLMDTFGALLPPTTEFQIGYFSGKQSTKYLG